ncbi:MAG: hypothetical protein ACREYD_08020 [Casimicrobiaceae bacterium]
MIVWQDRRTGEGEQSFKGEPAMILGMSISTFTKRVGGALFQCRGRRHPGVPEGAFLQALAPTQSEPPFIIAQVILLLIFIGLGVKAARAFHPGASAPALRPA